jgi:hypothetical protein
VARYFFHIRQDDRFYRDDEGIDLDDFDSLKAAVIKSSREAVSECALQARFEDGIFIIEDSRGKRVLEFPFIGTRARARPSGR